MDEVIKNFLLYSFDPIDWDWNKLTGYEKSLCSKEQFEQLKQWVNR